MNFKHGYIMLVLSSLAACRPGAAPLEKTRPERPVPRPPPVEKLQGDRALEEVRQFVQTVGRRDAGTPGAKRAADYIAHRMTAFGIDNQIQHFRDRAPMGTSNFYNVLGFIPGRREAWIVLGSHFDTKYGMPDGFEGANDSGSSTGLLLELGRLLQQAAPLEHPVLLAFFDGEESRRRYGPHDGLHGSRYLAEAVTSGSLRRPVRAMILLDMIGDRDLSVTLPRNGDPELTRLILDTARKLGVRNHFGLHRGGILDDHVPFLNAGIPAVNIIDFEFGSAPGRNDYWHTLEDSMDKLSADSLEVVGRVTLEALSGLAGARPEPH